LLHSEKLHRPAPQTAGLALQADEFALGFQNEIAAGVLAERQV
jgi:hypothetical protein